MRKSVELSERGTILAVIVVLALVYILGFLTNKKEENVEFTKSDIQAIESAMDMYGDTVIVTKDKDGGLVLKLGKN